MLFCPSCGKELSAEELKTNQCMDCHTVLEENPDASVTDSVVAESTSTKTKTNEFNAEDIKEKAAEVKNKTLLFVDEIVDKAKSVPILAKIFDKVDKKLHPVIVAAPVAAVVLIVMILFGTFSSGSCMLPLNDFLNQVNRKVANDDKLTSTLMADFRYKYTKQIANLMKDNDSYEEMLEAKNDRLEEAFEELDDEFDNWKIKFEKKSEKKMDKDDVEELQEFLDDYFDDYVDSSIDKLEDVLDDEDELEEYADMIDMDEKEVKKILQANIKYYKSFKDVTASDVYEVKGKFIITADKDKFKTETVKLMFAKINGDWVYAGCDGSLELEDSEGYFDFIMDYLESNYLTR